ncbi:hypothetical protein A2Y99_04575 [Candidatus Gottesmanbacteria bacterium RBG_13_37_7]|uniref:Ribosomal RNA large subunit methyltransferase K/L-like methyltransferase domain-containing protein n=1 Tax=Candidatus Gottesmanbacteria bacterium RBG_13_37_7 TaxID=1798369 RepID=A0A1F5YGB8_9BACT|nr:MAG: hypothetical protein A2Y99_04575 [Candidatus Gottesmanbacteria bacterium RBG_13_37_7]
MIKAFFILGSNPALSFSELLAIFERNKLVFEVESVSSETAVIIFQQQIDLSKLMISLGGTVKIGEILDEIDLEEKEDKFFEIFSAKNLLGKYIRQQTGKIHFGISLYSVEADRKPLELLADKIINLNILIKNNLKKTGRNAGFLRIKERNLSSVSVAKNGLLDKGAEIVLILTKKKILIGKTQTVQEFASFSFRDYGRPNRDKRSGMMPPKLARMMINLAKVEKEERILDPFCGSGTVIQESILLGYTQISGCDISSKSISDTGKNNDWLFKNYQKFKRSSYNISLLETNVLGISKIIAPNSIDAIVTEPYLGPPLYQKPDKNKVSKILDSLKNLYLQAFIEFQKIIKSKGKVVIIFPCFEMENQIYFLDIINQITKTGFRQTELIPKKYSYFSFLKQAPRQTIIFGDKWHFFWREILSFTKI